MAVITKIDGLACVLMGGVSGGWGVKGETAGGRTN